jgi:hypothetical protein
MKKTSLFILIVLLLSFLWYCKKDELTVSNKEDKEAMLLKDSLRKKYLDDSLAIVIKYEKIRDSLNKVAGIIEYSVSVVPGNTVGILNKQHLKSAEAIKGLSGAVVSISQYGVIQTKTTDETGIVTFDNLRIGSISVSIKKDNYTAVNYIAELIPQGCTDSIYNYTNVRRQCATIVPIFSLTDNLSKISGKITVESDLTNLAPENAENVEVIANIDVTDPYFTEKFLEYNTGDFLTGRISQIAYDNIITRAISDANGNYTINVPSAPNGLPIKISVSEFALNQTLLMNTVNDQPVTGVQSIRTIFSSDINGWNYSPSGIPNVAPAYVVFSEPTGTVNAQPLRKATGTAVISESGIESVVITNPGEGYTQAPKVVFTGGSGTGAIATASVTGGRVTGINFTDRGSGYKSTDNVTVSFVEDITTQATATPVISFSIVRFIINNAGSKYSSPTGPTITISSSKGSGATAVAIMDGYIKEIKVTNNGSNYTAAPKVIISGSITNSNPTATAIMSQYNPVKSISLATIPNLYFPSGALNVVISPSGAYGSGATATAALSTTGRINTITVTNGASGYTAVPTVTITGGGGYGAKAEAIIAGGSVTGIIILDRGSGYTSAPTISIAPSGTGQQATATATLEFPLASVTLVNGGNNYTSTPNVAINGIDITANCKIKMNMTVASVNITGGTNSGYTSNPTITFIPSDGETDVTSAVATADMAYSLKEVQITNGGSGYTSASDIYVNVTAPEDPTGTKAVITPVLGNGVVNSITLTNGGLGYTAPPVVTINYTAGNQPELDAVVTATVSGGRVTGFTVVNGGKGYTTAAGAYSVSIKTYSEAATALAKAYTKSGQILYINITDPGEGYAVAPVVEFVSTVNAGGTSVGIGTGAAATAVITDGRVTAVNITNGGSGYYTAPTVNFVVPTHSLTAKGTVNVDVNGYVTSININYGGMGYVTEPSVSIYPSVTGMGKDATARAVITNGSVTQVIITNKGSGYLGKNTPKNAKPFTVVGTAGNPLYAESGKSYVLDLQMGTGIRTIEQ